MLNFVLLGVGSKVDEVQMEEMAERVAVLVDSTMTVGSGGTIYSDNGEAIKKYEGGLPAVLEFQVPQGCKSFTLEIEGQRFTQPRPEEHEDDDDDDDHHKPAPGPSRHH